MLCAYMRPRYQVSVYRTNGPLVSYQFRYYLQLMYAQVILRLAKAAELPPF